MAPPHRSASPPSSTTVNERSALLESAQGTTTTWGAVAGAVPAPPPPAAATADEASVVDESVQGDEDEPKKGGKRLHGMRLAVTLLSVWGTNFTFALSTTAIATLSPQIASHFEHVELSSYIGSVFLLASTVFTPVFGAILDRLSRRRAMVFAGALFALGTLSCALSTSFWALLLSRAITGAGGAGILTLSSIITTDLISLRERGYYQGLMMTLFGIGAAMGGPVAGWISDRFGWQMAFLAQLPILLISLLSLYLLLPRSRPHTPPSTTSSQHPSKPSLLASLDLPGTSLLLLSVGSLLLGLSLHTSGFFWSSLYVSALLTTALVATCAFVFVERRREKQGGRVLVAWEVAGQRNVLWTCACAFWMNLANGSVMYNIPLYFILVRSSTSATAGLHLLPNSLGLSFGSLLSGQIIKSTGRYRLLGLISLLAPIGSALALSQWGDKTGWWEEWFDILPAGVGYSSYLVVSLIAIIASVPKEQIPKATAIAYFFRSLGGTLGVALCATLQQAVLSRELHARFTHEKTIYALIHAPRPLLATLPAEMRSQAIEAYAVSLRTTFAFTAFIGVVSLACAWPVREWPLGEKGGRVGGGKEGEEVEGEAGGGQEGGRV